MSEKNNPKNDDHPSETVVFINNHKHGLPNPVQTGRALKELGGIPLSDVLFLKQPHDDQVIPNDGTVTLKNGDHLYSQPPADYGDLLAGLIGARPLPQTDGSTFVIFDDYKVPDAYVPNLVRVLVKLPRLFPEAAPDMFFTTPIVRLANGAAPKGTSTTNILNEQWQQWSWHLKPGAWRPGISDLRDFMRCVRARFEKKD